MWAVEAESEEASANFVRVAARGGMLGSAMPDKSAATIASIYRYPVKGLSPERLENVMLSTGRPLPSDRRYAIENGPSGFDPAAPQYFPKVKFLMLMRNERLAALRTHYDDASHTLTIHADDAEVARADLQTPAGRAAIERYFAENFAEELRGPPKILHADGHSFSDVAKKVVSIVNLASVAALEGVTGRPIDPLRFRGNLHVGGLASLARVHADGREHRHRR